MTERNTDNYNSYLDFANFVGLELWGAVVVDEPNAAGQLGGGGKSMRARVTVCSRDNNEQWNNPKDRCVCVALTAIAMAMLASETVSMGEEMKGVFMVICLVSAEVRSWTKDTRRMFKSTFRQK